MSFDRLTLLRQFINEVLDGFGNKNLARDGVAGNLRYDAFTTGHQRGNILDDEEQERGDSDRSKKHAAACFIVSDDGKVLAVSRKDDPTDFGLPGGKVDPGETIKQAASRELEEETGLVAVELVPIYVGRDMDGFTTTTFACEVMGKIDTPEHGTVRWVDPKVLLDGSFGDYFKRFFEKLGIET